MKCKTCGKNCDGEYCFAHKVRKPLPSSGRGLTTRMSSISNKKINNVQNKEHLTEMREMFLSVWKKRPHRSEVSGQYLGQEALSTYFHHILPKNKYPEACLDEENIVLLSLLEHSNVENDMYKYEEINNRRKNLLIKYDK